MRRVILCCSWVCVLAVVGAATPSAAQVAPAIGGSFRSTVIEFAPVMEVTPTTGLVDGQAVTVSISGVQPFNNVHLMQCGEDDSTVAFGCDEVTGFATGPADAMGRLTAEVTAYRVIYAPGRTDCASTVCSLAMLDGSGGLAVSIPLGFAPGPPLAPETVRIDIKPVGTVRADGHRRSTMQAVASCDTAVRLDIRRVLHQSLPAPGFTDAQFGAVDCMPGEEVLVFSSFPPGFVVGPARMALYVTAVADGFEVARTGDAAEVMLVDEAAVVEVVSGLLADPANGELREQMLTAIRARLAQDPLFRQEFFAGWLNG